MRVLETLFCLGSEFDFFTPSALRGWVGQPGGWAGQPGGWEEGVRLDDDDEVSGASDGSTLFSLVLFRDQGGTKCSKSESELECALFPEEDIFRLPRDLAFLSLGGIGGMLREGLE